MHPTQVHLLAKALNLHSIFWSLLLLLHSIWPASLLTIGKVQGSQLLTPLHKRLAIFLQVKQKDGVDFLGHIWVACSSLLHLLEDDITVMARTLWDVSNQRHKQVCSQSAAESSLLLIVSLYGQVKQRLQSWGGVFNHTAKTMYSMKSGSFEFGSRTSWQAYDKLLLEDSHAKRTYILYLSSSGSVLHWTSDVHVGTSDGSFSTFHNLQVDNNTGWRRTHAKHGPRLLWKRYLRDVIAWWLPNSYC